MEKIIIDFSMPEEQHQWKIVNDPVMGGQSSSIMFGTEYKTFMFEGEVSLENYGGFASIRTSLRQFDFTGFRGLITRVRGDGKEYRFRLRTDESHEGIAYQVRFTTEQNTWKVVRLPFEAFTPVFRGQVIDDAPPLDKAHVRRIGFMIADKQAGLFRLEISWVKAYS
jgi:monofunctional biosynthetic peptidoglycan transglycosylase